MRRVLLFRNELLPISETFIVGQAGAMRRYEPWFAGLKRVPGGIDLDPARVIAAMGGKSLRQKIARRVYLRSGFAPRFLRRIEAVGPDLIHAHFATDACAALAIQERLWVPLIVTLHGYDVTSDVWSLRGAGIGRESVRRKLALWAKASVFVCVSDGIRQKALENGFPEEKLWVHRIGVDIEFFRPSGANGEEPLVLFVGRLVEKKGCVHLLRAMRIVENRVTDARLVVVGDGPLRKSLEAEARKTLSQCEFVGSVSAETVRQCMERAAVVAVSSVVASNGDSEGLCTVVCEAQAMGVPVVGFRGPGIEVVDGETGLLAPERDEGALAEGILTLLRDETMAERMGAAGRRRMEHSFDLRKQTALLEDKYDEVLGRG